MGEESRRSHTAAGRFLPDLVFHLILPWFGVEKRRGAVAWPQSVGDLGKILYDGRFSVSLSSLFSCTLDTRKR